MTAREASDFVNTEIDQFGFPDISDVEMSHWLNEALFNFRQKYLPVYQKDEWVRRAFLPLRVQFPPTVPPIDTSAIANFSLCTSLGGRFNYQGTVVNVPIRFITDDTEVPILTDPFASPTNISPKAQTINTAGVNSIVVFSDTPPISVDMVYLRQYNQLDVAAQPNVVMDFNPDLTHVAICLMAVVDILKTFEDPRLQTEVYEQKINTLTPAIK